ncbi:M1 family aminopeptidase [Aureliella helgolandensis]|uniref:Peptidase M1 membrane alanine aminopeptidase domain-containing protein n=1 Tax=Aureliella helgolandensis TaxID=2527968 RepID=A0A518GEN5_9BACT|nr:M1 family aminopeptidase [Aureliella helgolandensis]QDV27017.1 hypothetical protein Q31a_53980 [Aureliella helgolandensis]
MVRSILFVILMAHLCIGPAWGQVVRNEKYGQEDKFRQLEESLPTPNTYRNASGEPGPAYWQQRADYVIDVQLDDQKQHVTGRETVTYHNHSPHALRYLWLQVDANLFSPDSDANKLQTFKPDSRLSLEAFRKLQAKQAFDGGAEITKVVDESGSPLPYTLVKTMMRIDLPQAIAPGEQFKFSIDWNYQVNDSDIVKGRTGCEYFEKDKNYIYEIAQWFPRLVAYTDANGWQHKQYLGTGEFTLELGDYLVRITVPKDHIVAATGVLQNAGEVLSEEQKGRLERARTAKRPVFVVTPDEALANQKEQAEGEQTWVFHAQNVRDFAWASSRKFIWDAQGHAVEGNSVMAMSFYPNEAEPLWSQYSTHSIIHTLNVYSRYTFGYPYPTAISVNGPVYGMEYPMICFNGPRPDEDGTYSERTKYGLISVVIHEVGHNYFPMIVNSDERQWTWMDEGLNTFLQYLAEQEWEDEYPSQRGEPSAITGYMRSSQQVPIMTNSESVLNLGANAYGKPATALNILRESILGRELFDFAFKEYARRWKFKRPMPADFFRTMEDASGVDLDWFWRGWFYTTDHCDIAIDSVSWKVPDEGDPDAISDRKRQEKADRTPTLSDVRNQELAKRIDEFPELKDFYNNDDPFEVTPESRKAYARMLEKLTEEERELLANQQNFYTITFKNLGGLVMPMTLRVLYEDESEEILRLPAEIWRRNNQTASTSVLSDKVVKSFELDPYRESADTNRDNNYFPPRFEPSRFQLYKNDKPRSADNPMKSAARKAEAERKRKESEAKKAAEKEQAESEKDATEKDAAEKAAPAADSKKPAATDNPNAADAAKEEVAGETKNSQPEATTDSTDGAASESEAQPAEPAAEVRPTANADDA